MKHPFELNSVDEKQLDAVTGGRAIPVPSQIQPLKPPVFFTQAIGEDGGDYPTPDLT